MLSVAEYPTHFSVDQALAFAKTLNSKNVRFVGMSHSLGFEETNAYIAKHLQNARLATEGESVL